MAIFGGSSNNKGSAPAQNAGRRFVLTWPEFGLVRSWFKAYMFLHVLLLNGAAFVVSFPKKGDNLHQGQKDTWVNVLTFIIFLSTSASVANTLHEIKEKVKSWNWFKVLILMALLIVNYNIINISYSKKREGVDEDETNYHSNWQLALYGVSCFLTGVTSFIKLVQNEREAAVDDPDLELGNHPWDGTTHPQYKDGLTDCETSLKTVIIMMENVWSTNHRLARDNQLLQSWLERADCE